MALNSNQFALTTVVGTKVMGNNVIQAKFYSASADATITPGEAVVVVSTTAGNVVQVAKGAAATDLYFGVVLTNPLKSSFAVGDVCDVALATTVVMMTASAAITAGAKVQYDYSTGKIATQTATNTVIGMAMDDASTNGDLVRVYVNPTWLSSGEANTLAALGTGSDGESLVGSKVGSVLNTKRIKAGTGITITSETNDIVIALT